MRLCWLALSFLTTLPTPQIPFIEGGLGKSARWFPLVGLLIGGLLGLIWQGAALFFPPTLVAVILTLSWVLITGGLHLDGFADCCDGLFVPVSRERRLKILRDPQLGTFATLGLILLLALKMAALMTIFAKPLGSEPLLALLLAPTVARWLILPVAKQPTAHAGGMGDSFAKGLTATTLMLAAILPLGLTLVAGWRGLIALLLAHLVAMAWVRLAKGGIGGVTGDVYGAVVESAELAILLVYAAYA